MQQKLRNVFDNVLEEAELDDRLLGARRERYLERVEAEDARPQDGHGVDVGDGDEQNDGGDGLRFLKPDEHLR